MNDKPESPIKSGWRGNLNGYVEDTDKSHIEVSEVTLKLDSETAWALCNVLTDESLKQLCIEHKGLSQLGAALGRLIDHLSANNGFRELIK